MVVAFSLLTTVFASVAYVVTNGLADVGLGKQRVVADRLAGETAEQMRAVAFTTVANGLDDGDLATADPNITKNGSTYTFTNGETIPHGSLGYTQAPLVPHRRTTVVNGTTFSIAVYVTNLNGVAGAYRATVIVSWTRPLRQGVVPQVSVQTVVYSPPNGCLADTTHPFAGPCQGFFYGGVSTSVGSIRITSAGAGDAITGITLNQAQITLPAPQMSVQNEQIVNVQSAAQTSGLVLDVSGQSPQTGGAAKSTVVADNDPGAPGQPTGAGLVTQTGSTSLTATGSGPKPSVLTINAGAADSGALTSLAGTSQTLTCTTPTGGLSAVTPCGSATATAPAASATLALISGGNTSLGAAPLASVSPVTPAVPQRAFAAVFGQFDGTYCVGTSSPGCVAAALARTIGTVKLGGLPPKVISDGKAPAGWAAGNYLVQLTNYADAVSVESGVHAGAPGAHQIPATGQTNPSLSYWNGAGYTSVPVTWGGSPPAITIPTVTVTDNTLNPSVTVTITANLRTTAATTATSVPSGCRPCTATATAGSPIVGDVIYTVADSSTLAQLDIAVDLGTATAQTTYEAAPNAG